MPGNNNASKPITDVIDTDSRVTIPLAVVLQRKIDSSKKWAFPQWSVYSIVSTDNLQQRDKMVTVHDDGNIKRVFWGGAESEFF